MISSERERPVTKVNNVAALRLPAAEAPSISEPPDEQAEHKADI